MSLLFCLLCTTWLCLFWLTSLFLSMVSDSGSCCQIQRLGWCLTAVSSDFPQGTCISFPLSIYLECLPRAYSSCSHCAEGLMHGVVFEVCSSLLTRLGYHSSLTPCSRWSLLKYSESFSIKSWIAEILKVRLIYLSSFCLPSALCCISAVHSVCRLLSAVRSVRHPICPPSALPAVRSACHLLCSLSALSVIRSVRRLLCPPSALFTVRSLLHVCHPLPVVCPPSNFCCILVSPAWISVG